MEGGGGRIRAGGYPPAIELDARQRAQWFEGYVRAFLEHDLRDLSAVGNVLDVHRLFRLACMRVGGMLNESNLARDASLSQPTAHRYLNLFERALQLFRLPPFVPSRSKRLIKTPKLYCTDTGIAAHMAGIHEADALLRSDLAGALLENLVLVHLLAWRETSRAPASLYYWRTHSGFEVDFVIESANRALPIEVKASGRVGPGDAAGLREFLAQQERSAPFGILLYRGDETIPIDRRVLAVPLSRVLGA